MASSALATPGSYHKLIPSARKSKLEPTKVRSEDELLKFFLHGSYDVQRGNSYHPQIEGSEDKTKTTNDETKTNFNSNSDDFQIKSRCMFEETYMINISVKQPDQEPTTKQIDVRIEKTPSDTHVIEEKFDDDEISSIFDEEDNDDVESVIFNDIQSSTSDISTGKLTLADMINKTLTTIPSPSPENIPKTQNWYVEQNRSTNEDSKAKPIEKSIKTPPTLTTNINEDKKLFEYLDYLETKEETNQSIQTATTKPTKSNSPTTKIPSKQEQIPIIDLEQLCRSLTVNDLKDELIRKKIYELKILIDERHKKCKSQIPLIKTRKDNLPVLIAMPPLTQQRRRTNLIQSTPIQQSKTLNNLQGSYNSTYQEIISNCNKKPSPSTSNTQQFTRCQIASTNTNRKYQHTGFK